MRNLLPCGKYGAFKILIRVIRKILIIILIKATFNKFKRAGNTYGEGT